MALSVRDIFDFDLFGNGSSVVSQTAKVITVETIGNTNRTIIKNEIIWKGIISVQF